MATRPNPSAELEALLRARGEHVSSARRFSYSVLRSLSYLARGHVIPAIPLPDPPLRDGNVLLRTLGRADAGAVARACQDPAITRWTTVPLINSERDARRFIDAAERDRKAARALTLAVVRDGEFAGASTLTCDWEHRKGEVGCWITRASREQNVATRALQLVAHWAIDELRLERIELLSHADNEASQRLAVRAGFAREGLLRAYRPSERGREDLVLFSLLPTDPNPSGGNREVAGGAAEQAQPPRDGQPSGARNA
jgi:RimJ/RimL family protein N-acetyltransferase